MNGEVKRLLDTMRVERRGYRAAADDPALLSGLLRQFAIGGAVTGGLRSILGQPRPTTGEQRFDDVFGKRLSVPRTFVERAAWTVFWAFAYGSDSVTQAAHATDAEPELNGALLKAVEEGCRRFRPPARRSGASDCVAVAFLNLAKLGNEAITGADFGLALQIEVEGRTVYLVTHVQAKRAKARTTSVHRRAGNETQIRRLLKRGYGRFLFYNQHDGPAGLLPTTKSAEFVGAESGDGARPVDPLRLADDFAASIAGAVSAGASAMRGRPGGSGASLPGYRFVDTLDDAVDLLFPVEEPDMAVSKLLVARVGERRFTVEDVRDLRRTWQEAVDRRAETMATGFATEHRGREELPPINGS